MNEAMKKIDQYVMPTYVRQAVTFVRGEGATLYDDQGKAYLDFLAGIAVVNLGHAHPAVTRAIGEQAARLVHVSNLFYTEPQAEVAELLVKNTFADQVFFCNSGAEANEGALKLARLWGKKHLDGAHGVIAMAHSFHGRTLNTLTATGQAKVQDGFAPLAPGFKHVPYGDLPAVLAAWDGNTGAVLVEPVLGEGGVVLPPAGYLKGLRELCDQRGALLIFDEVQTGLGRTGRLFAYEQEGVVPDVLSVAKGLANGLPAGAVLARAKVAELFSPGKHGTTFGGGPVVMAAAAATLRELTQPAFLARVRAVGEHFLARLNELKAKHPGKVAAARGLGLILGLELKAPGAALVGTLLKEGFVINCTQERVLRFLPPLVVSEREVDALAAALDRALAAWPA